MWTESSWAFPESYTADDNWIVCSSDSGQCGDKRAHYSTTKPERLLCNQGYDIRSDVWRLGTSLVELATGASPYAGKQFDTVFELLQHIFMASPPLPDRSRFSPEFYDFVSQCLTRDVEHRPHYTELLQHPLIKKYEWKSVDIALWFNGVCKKHGLRQDKTYIHMK